MSRWGTRTMRGCLASARRRGISRTIMGMRGRTADGLLARGMEHQRSRPCRLARWMRARRPHFLLWHRVVPQQQVSLAATGSVPMGSAVRSAARASLPMSVLPVNEVERLQALTATSRRRVQRPPDRIPGFVTCGRPTPLAGSAIGASSSIPSLAEQGATRQPHPPRTTRPD